MTLLEELKERADKLDAELLALSGRMKEVERASDELHTCINALDIAEMDAEDEAQEWAEAELLPVQDEQPELFEDEPQEIEAPALADPPSAELRSVPGTEEEVRDQFEEERERAAAIELTADFPPEPEFIVLDQETCEPVQPQWNEPQTEGYAHVTDAWVETTPGTLAEYTPPTNPEADALAKAHEYYSPEKVAERNRFNPWGGVAHLFGKPKVDA